MAEPSYWFRAKRYGWGWSLPASWQGWLVLGLYVLLSIGGALGLLPLLTADPLLYLVAFLAYIGLLSVLLFLICLWKGEPPHWRWGNRVRDSM